MNRYNEVNRFEKPDASNFTPGLQNKSNFQNLNNPIRPGFGALQSGVTGFGAFPGGVTGFGAFQSDVTGFGRGEIVQYPRKNYYQNTKPPVNNVPGIIPVNNLQENMLQKVKTKKELQVSVNFVEGRQVLTTEEGDLLKASLQNEALSAAQVSKIDPNQPQLKFDKMGVTDSGGFLITPFDSTTRDWLLHYWQPPKLDGRVLKVILALVLDDYTRIKIPFNPPHCEDIDRVRTLLAFQNQELKVDCWKFVSKEPWNNKFYLVFDIDKVSRSALEKADWRVWFLMIMLEVTLLGKTPV